jgi:hypothetical protein
MADYNSLLARLVESLPDSSPALRDGVYERARKALAEQLKNVQPPLTEFEIQRERESLEEAVAQVELRHGGTPRPAAPLDSLPRVAPKLEVPPEPPPAPPPRARPAAIAIKRGGRRQRPVALVAGLCILALPIAALAWMWRDRPARPVAEPVPAPAVTAQVPAGDNKFGERVVGGTAPTPAPRSPASAPAGSAPAQSPPAQSRPGQVPPGQVPATPAPGQAAPQGTVGPQGTAAPQVAATPSGAAPSGAGPSGAAPSDLAVAQRALFFEENPADPNNPTLTAGRAIWRLDALNSGQGQPLETVVRGSIEIPAAGLSLTLLLRRNLDPALPASHTIELTFATAQAGQTRTVRDVVLPMMRPEETIRGVPLAGLPVPVKENVFLIGLSDMKSDVERNTELLLRRNWIELPIRFASGQKAALLFDKGVSGERVFLDAFRQWGQAP